LSDDERSTSAFISLGCFPQPDEGIPSSGEVVVSFTRMVLQPSPLLCAVGMDSEEPKCSHHPQDQNEETDGVRNEQQIPEGIGNGEIDRCATYEIEGHPLRSCTHSVEESSLQLAPQARASHQVQDSAIIEKSFVYGHVPIYIT
jgi:hypothetical protein